MNIVVCIKQVPDVLSLRMDRKRMTIIREGVESVINPLDYDALYMALELKRKEGAHITVMTMGPPQSEEALREAMGAGADRGILLTDPAFAGADTLATSHVLASAISRERPFPDLILCGVQTVDSDTGHVGPQVAEELGLPQVCGVEHLHLEGGDLVAAARGDGFVETIRARLPAVVTVAGGAPSMIPVPLGAVQDAFEGGEVIRLGLKELSLAPEEVGLQGSATRVVRLHPPKPARQGEMVEGPSETLVEALIRKLESLSILDEEEDHG